MNTATLIPRPLCSANPTNSPTPSLHSRPPTPPPTQRLKSAFFAKSLLQHRVVARGRNAKFSVFASADSTSDDVEISTGDATEDEVDVGVCDVEEEVDIPIPPPLSASPGEPSEIEELKQALVDSLYGTDRGFRASSETRGEVAELIAQLEASNPNPSTTEALSLLDGKWILAYTSFSELFPLLAAGSLPLVSVGEISQTINTLSSSVQNGVTFSGPLASFTFTTNATYEVRSSKRLKVKFEEGVIEPPKVTSSLELPDTLEVAGQRVELSSFQGVIRPLEEAASAVARIISGQPPLKFPFPSAQAQSWLLTTYLDNDLRISRGDGGSLFILVKEGSSLKLT